MSPFDRKTKFFHLALICLYAFLWNWKITIAADFNCVLQVIAQNSSSKIWGCLNNSCLNLMTTKSAKQCRGARKRMRDVGELKWCVKTGVPRLPCVNAVIMRSRLWKNKTLNLWLDAPSDTWHVCMCRRLPQNT